MMKVYKYLKKEGLQFCIKSIQNCNLMSNLKNYFLNIKSKMHDIAILNDILFAFKS